jgi:hypothetical protein
VGPGTHLKRILRRLAGPADRVCGCDFHARLMDERGPDWCAGHAGAIAGWLAAAAARRGRLARLAARPFLLRRLVGLAVRRARRDAAPGVRGD